MGSGSTSLLDYRRRVAELYAAVRAEPEPEAAHRRWCAERDELYATHPDSPLTADDPRRTAGLPVAPYVRALRFTAVLQPADPTRLEVTTGTDGTVVFTRLGALATPLGTLDAWWLTGYGGGLWVPVRDGSSGSASYGGGRYLLDTVKGADLGARGEALVIDLNFLYNPSCAYDPAWACPLAPPGNRLEAAVDAGELDLSR